MYSARQKTLDQAILLNDLKLVRKLAKQIMKSSIPNPYTIRSRATLQPIINHFK